MDAFIFVWGLLPYNLCGSALGASRKKNKSLFSADFALHPWGIYVREVCSTTRLLAELSLHWRHDAMHEIKQGKIQQRSE